MHSQWLRIADTVPGWGERVQHAWLSDGLLAWHGGLQVSQGYFQPNVGGANIPVSAGELSDLAGDEPLFKALYKWCVCAWLHA